MFKHAIAVAGLTISLFSAPFVAPASASDAALPKIEVVSVNGSGCPSGTASVRATSANTFSLAFSDFAAWTGTEAPATAVRKNCQVTVSMKVAEGGTFSPRRLSYDGFVYLPDGASARALVHFYCQGSGTVTNDIRSFNGPMSSDWRAPVRPALDENTRCDAGKLLNINTELRVSRGSAPENVPFGLLALQSMDVAISAMK
jgi:hypothetical protein